MGAFKIYFLTNITSRYIAQETSEQDVEEIFRHQYPWQHYSQQPSEAAQAPTKRRMDKETGAVASLVAQYSWAPSVGGPGRSLYRDILLSFSH